MKKLFTLLAATLAFSTIASAQFELEEAPAFDLTLMPRFEAGVGAGEFDYSGTILYGAASASLGEHIELFAAGIPVDAYGQGSLSYCYAGFNFGNWSFQLGKNMSALGGLEYEDWDWDCFWQLESTMWNNMDSYRWGGVIAYTTSDESTTFQLQAASSPWESAAFRDGLGLYSGKWYGYYGPWTNIWSVSAIERAPGKYDWVLNLGQKVELGDFSLGFDWFNVAGDPDCLSPYCKGNTILWRAGWTPSDRVDIEGRFLMENIADRWDMGGGAYAYFFPIEENPWLRLGLHAGYTPVTGGFSCSASVIYFLHTANLFKK